MMFGRLQDGVDLRKRPVRISLPVRPDVAATEIEVVDVRRAAAEH